MESILQADGIDVAQWKVDELYFNYPEGARSKNAIFPPDNLALPHIKAARRYLYKRSDKRYPDQFWGEVVAYQVGGLLDVQVPPAYAAYNSLNADCGALIEWFYEDAKAQLTPGGQYMQRLIPGFDRKRGLQHNYHHVQVIGKMLAKLKVLAGEWEQGWADAFLFDALIGNTDRHQDNWGCLISKKKNQIIVSLSPLFDNGTSLGHERFPAIVEKWTDQDYRRYVEKGTHHMRWQKGDDQSCGHFEMLKRIAQAHPFVHPVMLRKIRNFNIDALRNKLDHLCTLNLAVPLTQGRKNLYIKLIAMRRNQIELALS